MYPKSGKRWGDFSFLFSIVYRNLLVALLICRRQTLCYAILIYISTHARRYLEEDKEPPTAESATPHPRRS